MCMISYLYETLDIRYKAIFLDNFDLSGKGLFYTYKQIQKSTQKFTIEMDGTGID